MPRKQKALSDDQISSLVAAANAQLKAANVGLIVFRRGLKLNLRGRLPGNRPGSTSGKTAPHQQTVSLDIMANPAGIEQAKQKVMEWGSLLAQQRFRWQEVLYDNGASETCEAWIERFRQHALESIIRAKSEEEAELKWRTNYFNPALSKLRPQVALTSEELQHAARRTRPNTRSRQLCCQVLTRFARFADVELVRSAQG